MNDSDVVLDTLTITRHLNHDGDDIISVSVDGDSGLTMHLGMIDIARDTLYRMADKTHDPRTTAPRHQRPRQDRTR